MTVQEFFTKYNGKGIDYDNYYGFQCVDLYRQYAKECLEYPQSPGVRGASDIWDSYLKDYYERINNDPDAVPQLGDIVIWNKNAGGGFGHVGIFSFGDVNTFISFDQNWPLGSLCHFQNHNYTNVQGWLRPKNFVIEQPQPVGITDQTRIPQIDNKEVQQIKAELLAKDSKIAGLEANVAKLKDDLAECRQTPPDASETVFEKKLGDYIILVKKALG